MNKKIKIEKGNFTTLYNDILRAEINGEKLSLEAWGLYFFMMSLPEDWDFSIMGLTKVVNAGKNKIQRVLKDLENAGFIQRKQLNNGKFGKVEYTLLHKPINPFPQKPPTENPHPQNQPQQSTKELNTKELNDKKNDKGQNAPKIENHFLTNYLIQKNIVDALSVDIEKYNDLFKNLDSSYNYNDVKDATRYLVSYLLKNNYIDTISNLYEFIKTSMFNNLELIENKNKNNKPEMLNEYLLEIKNMDSNTEVDKYLNELWLKLWKKIEKSIINFFKDLDKDKGVTGFSISVDGIQKISFTKKEISEIASKKEI